MAKKLQLRGGTTSEHSTFTGAVREVTVDTSKDTLVIHDGTTQGGFPLARESDIPTGALASLNSVGASQIADNAITDAKVADNALSGDKIDGGTISNFTSTGIDDNATSTAITIDASENVGIGTGAAAVNSTLTVGSTDAGATITSGGINTHLQMKAMGSSGALIFGAGGVANGTAGTERMRITADGRGLSQFTAFAWANIGLDNVAVGNTTPDGSHNISSVTLVSAGNARFNFTNTASTGNVSSQCTTNYFYIKCNGTTTSYVDVTAYNSVQVASSASLVNVATFGGN